MQQCTFYLKSFELFTSLIHLNSIINYTFFFLTYLFDLQLICVNIWLSIEAKEEIIGSSFEWIATK